MSGRLRIAAALGFLVSFLPSAKALQEMTEVEIEESLEFETEDRDADAKYYSLTCVYGKGPTEKTVRARNNGQWCWGARDSSSYCYPSFNKLLQERPGCK